MKWGHWGRDKVVSELSDNIGPEMGVHQTSVQFQDMNQQLIKQNFCIGLCRSHYV